MARTKRERWKGKHVRVQRDRGKLVTWYYEKPTTRIEEWKKYGSVEVTRDVKGRLPPS